MIPRFRTVAAAVVLALTACSSASNVGVEPPVNTNINLMSDVSMSDVSTNDIQTGAPPKPDPSYGSQYGMGGTFQPFTVPGF